MKNLLKNYNGITLISLVVTIIVLIILAGVGINAVLGENGIINIAKKAKENMLEAMEQEQLELNNLYEQIELGEVTDSELQYNLITKYEQLKSEFEEFKTTAYTKTEIDNKILTLENTNSNIQNQINNSLVGFIDTSNVIQPFSSYNTWESDERTVTYTATENCICAGSIGLMGYSDVYIYIDDVLINQCSFTLESSLGFWCPISMPIKKGQTIKFSLNGYFNQHKDEYDVGKTYLAKINFFNILEP